MELVALVDNAQLEKIEFIIRTLTDRMNKSPTMKVMLPEIAEALESIDPEFVFSRYKEHIFSLHPDDNKSMLSPAMKDLAVADLLAAAE